MENRQVYLDNNSSTLMTNTAIETMVAWCNRGSTMASHESAKEANNMVKNFRKFIATKCGISLNSHDVIITSSSAESNSHFIVGTVRGYLKKTGKLPHIIIGPTEPTSIYKCCKDLEDEGLAQLSIARNIEEFNNNIRANTCFLSYSTANGYSGIINDVETLIKIAHNRKQPIPVHTDMTFTIGKYPTPSDIDAFSTSFCSIGGPLGIGILVVRRILIDGYGINPLIYSAPPNIPAIGACFEVFKTTITDRATKDQTFLRYKNAIVNTLSSRLSTAPLTVAAATAKLLWVTGDKTLPNTLMFIVNKPGFHNKIFQENLEKHKIIIGHDPEEYKKIAIAMNVMNLLNGFVHISFSDYTTVADIKTLIPKLLEYI